MLDHARGLLRTRINPKLAEVLPEKYLADAADLEVMSANWANGGNSGPAFYQSGSSAALYLNTAGFRELPRFQMAAVLMHEAVGHHAQLGAFNVQNEELPDFLTFM